MASENQKDRGVGRLQASGPANRQYAWKERTYAVPAPSRKAFEWKASALRSLERLHRTQLTGHPVTVVVPALYNVMPAESVALGWLNDIDALQTIRHRIAATARLFGWDVFTFHTQHNLDSFFSSTIGAVRETWLHEGCIKADSVAETSRRFGSPYDYHRLQARLVENLVFQSSFMEWLTARASDVPLHFHVIGTAVMSALVWSGAAPFVTAARLASKIGSQWDNALGAMAEDELKRNQSLRSEENVGWLRFHRVRQLVEGRAALSLSMPPAEVPEVDAPARPFWFSRTAGEAAVLIQTARDVRLALEGMNLGSWSPELPPAVAGDPVRGFLISSMHPMASTCRWSVYNYLLATPSAALLFMNHIAPLGRAPLMALQAAAGASKSFTAVQDKRHGAFVR